jgi:hypothetical protein
MDNETIPIIQLPLFDYGESITNIVEMFPAVWKATECLTSQNSSIRQRGIGELVDLGAQKVSPLVAYMIATCICDPVTDIRRRATYIVADLIGADSNIKQTPTDVRMAVTNYLHNMRDDTVYDLLEVAIADEQAEKSIFHIFNACPHAGRYLGEILSEWKNALVVREKAIYFIGLVGYLEALPVLERILNRLETRQAGQYAMAFAPPSMKSDDILLPTLRIAIEKLNAR